MLHLLAFVPFSSADRHLNRSGKRKSRWNLLENGGGFRNIQTFGCLLRSIIPVSSVGFSVAEQTIVVFNFQVEILDKDCD